MIDEDIDDMSEWRVKLKKTMEKILEKMKVLGNVTGRKGGSVGVPKEIEDAVKKL